MNNSWVYIYSRLIKEMAAELKQVGQDRYTVVTVDDLMDFSNQLILGILYVQFISIGMASLTHENSHVQMVDITTVSAIRDSLAEPVCCFCQSTYLPDVMVAKSFYYDIFAKCKQWMVFLRPLPEDKAVI
jgi:hypothetical protein